MPDYRISKADVRLARGASAQKQQFHKTRHTCRMWTAEDAAILGRRDALIYAAARTRMGSSNALDCSHRYIVSLNA